MESSVLYYVARNGQQFGPYTIEQIRQFVTERRFQMSDFAWESGTTEWVPLSSLKGGDAVLAIASLGGGTRISPADHIMPFCPKCGAKILAGDARFCNSCGGAISFQTPATAEATRGGGTESICPWCRSHYPATASVCGGCGRKVTYKNPGGCLMLMVYVAGVPCSFLIFPPLALLTVLGLVVFLVQRYRYAEYLEACKHSGIHPL
jgi:hypothetical protein